MAVITTSFNVATGGGCECCGGVPPTECACAMILPISYPIIPPYASYSDAATDIATRVADCLAVDADSASFDGATLLSDVDNSGGESPTDRGTQSFVSLSLKAGEVVTIGYTITTNGSSPSAQIDLYDCNWAGIVSTDSASGSSGSMTVTAPADGVYYLSYISLVVSATTLVFDITGTADDVWWVNPVIALWDDSGTTRQLEACPKMYLPPLTESTGTWYADCAAAASAISSLTDNCVGFCSSLGGPGAPVLTATDGGSSLAMSLAFSPSSGVWPECYGSINAEAGETLSFAMSVTAGTPTADVLIYDYTGTLVENVTGAGPAVSSALPYTGRYIIRFFMNLSASVTTGSMTVTSSGTLTVNEIQALYDIGLDCSGRLNCGDSCP